MPPLLLNITPEFLNALKHKNKKIQDRKKKDKSRIICKWYDHPYWKPPKYLQIVRINKFGKITGYKTLGYQTIF